MFIPPFPPCSNSALTGSSVAVESIIVIALSDEFLDIYAARAAASVAVA